VLGVTDQVRSAGRGDNTSRVKVLQGRDSTDEAWSHEMRLPSLSSCVNSAQPPRCGGSSFLDTQDSLKYALPYGFMLFSCCEAVVRDSSLAQRFTRGVW